jgi:hypothetical protein
MILHHAAASHGLANIIYRGVVKLLEGMQACGLHGRQVAWLSQCGLHCMPEFYRSVYHQPLIRREQRIPSQTMMSLALAHITCKYGCVWPHGCEWLSLHGHS